MTLWLYEHEDGRLAVGPAGASFTVGEPRWHRGGPCEVHDPARDALLTALEWREQFEPRNGEDANERFERIAETFRLSTGYLRPGKDCRMYSPEERQAVWDEWMEEGRTKARAAIALAKEST